MVDCAKKIHVFHLDLNSCKISAKNHHQAFIVQGHSLILTDKTDKKFKVDSIPSMPCKRHISSDME